MNAIKVVIADDHKIIRVGLRGLLEREKDIAVVGEAENAEDIEKLLADHPADVILMDIDLGEVDGIAATKRVKELFPALQVLGLTMHEEPDYIIKMLEAGASGYLLKNAGREELLTAIHTVAKGDSYFSQKVSATLLQAVTRQKMAAPDVKKTNIQTPLSEREIEVLRLIAQEYSNGEIAEKLFISIRTVDTHRRNLLEKLQVKNTVGLVKYAINKGLI
ncbi:MAG TPA: response regulator transcription factor [Cyclobacteriaceae bacterium]|nr:response regulator transcription factor [Cyclobacteriaceae bacterium]